MNFLDETTFIEQLRQCEGRLFRIGWAILGQESDAWDVLQETVERAWRYRKDLRGDSSSFFPWIHRIHINCCIKQVNNRRRVIFTDLENLPEPEPASPVENDIEMRAVWDVVKSLDNTHRQVVVLRYLGDMSLQEIASALNVPIGTVKSRLNRAISKLRENFGVNLEGRVISEC